jgi:2-polyprenyl-6-methoxyphenol hydroxylase-like FAD-dependent oxidoreductase
MGSDRYDQDHADVPVLVAGGGPVGLTLGLDLSARGVHSLVVERRTGNSRSPRCNTTTARSMEHYRRLGLARRIRETGLPADWPTDVAYVTSLTGFEFARFEFPSAGQVLDGELRSSERWPTPEPPHRISQIQLEPILEQAALDAERVDLLAGHQIVDVRQDDDGVTSVIERVEDGVTREIRSRFLVGCDGGRSTVRKTLGISFAGEGQVAPRRVSIYFRSTTLMRRLRRPAWMYYYFAVRYRGMLVQIDGSELFLCHTEVAEGTDPEDVVPGEVLAEAIGAPADVDILDVVRWTPRRLVADRYRDGRVFLAGDAAHLWPPSGGFGMNAGIADAVDLSWKLAATCAGWGGGALLDSYEAERRQVGQQLSRIATGLGWPTTHRFVDDVALREPGPAGERARRAAAEQVLAGDRKRFDSVGAQLGYVYRDSPVIPSMSPEGPPLAVDRYQQELIAGGRLPHAWLADGRALYDVLDRDFTILAPRDRDSGRALAAAMTAEGVPHTLLHVDEPGVLTALDGQLVLVRPDQHVAWHGRELPRDPRALVRRVVGRGADARLDATTSAEYCSAQ